jgi:hypothetical protein
VVSRDGPTTPLPVSGAGELSRLAIAASLAYLCRDYRPAARHRGCLAGGIIWYNAKKSNELAIAAAERMILAASEDILDRIKLLYDPMYAIVGFASWYPN